MNLTYYRLELQRLSRDYVTMFFTVGLPAFFYLIFGAAPDYGSDPIREGNVAMYLMIGFAAYGAVTSTTGLGGASAIERMQGWGRQLGLTPMSERDFVTVKSATAMTIAAVPVVLIYLIGWLTGAQAPLSVWIGSAAVLLIGAGIFAIYGLCFGLAFRSEAAVGAAAGSLVILAFLGNIFTPLGGWQLTMAKFTPMYGYVALARRGLTGGGNLDAETGALIGQPLWQVLANLVFWTVALAVLAVVLVGRSRGRQ